MKYVKQFTIILLTAVLGELLHTLLPLPIPGSVYGLLLMLLCLLTGLLRLEQVERVGSLLIELMPLMFLPATAGLMNSWDAMRGVLVPLIVICLLTTVLVMVVSGKTTDALLSYKDRRGRRKGGTEDE